MSLRAFTGARNSKLWSTRAFSVSAVADAAHRVVIVGGGTAGITVAAQLKAAFDATDKPLKKDDIAIVDPAELHHYQPGWTLVGAGLRSLSGLSRPLASVVPEDVKLYQSAVSSFAPEKNIIKTDKDEINYDYLVVVPGLKLDWEKVKGLKEAIAKPDSKVASIYSYESVERVWDLIKQTKSGKAIFTQPAGIIKCAGAPQKILWMALSQWKREGVRDDIDIAFATGTPTMFGVEKYSKALEELRKERDVEGLFSHNLVEVKDSTAVFATPSGNVERLFDFLHAVPPQGPLDFVKNSPLADEAGWVNVDKATTQHVKYPNVFSIGDASSLPNSKTAAAVSVQTPVLVDNLVSHSQGKPLVAAYDGYASCPLLTGHGELMLCEFKYGGIPKETFAPYFGSQDKPSWLFYQLKKSFFPYIYWSAFLKGIWYGPNVFSKPTFEKSA